MLTLFQFRENVEQFITDFGVAATRLGRESIGDPRFVHDLRHGRTPSLRTASRVCDWIADYTLHFKRSVPVPMERTISIGSTEKSESISGNSELFTKRGRRNRNA